jgi:hypothetical protein
VDGGDTVSAGELEQQYRQLKALTKVKATAQRPRQRRELLAMIQALSARTAAGDDSALHERVEQLRDGLQRDIGSVR